MEPIRTRDVSIVGRVVGVFRKVAVAMTMLLLERDPELQLRAEDGGGATLDDLLSGAWERLPAPARRRAPCAQASSSRAGPPAPPSSADAAGLRRAS